MQNGLNTLVMPLPPSRVKMPALNVDARAMKMRKAILIFSRAGENAGGMGS